MLTPPYIIDLPSLLEINLVMSLVFFILAISLISLILYLRVHKNFRNQRKDKLEVLLIDFINNYLFNEDFDKPNEINRFIKNQLKTTLDKKVATKQLLVYAENLKGESSAVIKEIFYGFGLYNFLIQDLTQKEWYRQARALNVAYQLDMDIPMDLVDSFINAKNKEVRQQAFLYLIHRSTDNPLGFLDKVTTPLTLWEQIHIENGLKTYEGVPPDFSRWLYHKLTSVVVFNLKMIADYNQYQHIPILLKFLNHKDLEIRLQTIISLRKMEAPEMIPILVENFSKENPQIKKEILITLGEIGLEEQLKSVAPFILQEELDLRVSYLKIARHLNPGGAKEEIDDFKKITMLQA
ncbi:HEAT repeat domain-containing protein [Arenibacter latericius]|uniref:HEAT repeat domain-containing protein n=1 Tax=Arenibacter latericius TaxID=86104 RepID=UPI00047B4F66|nr:HEAT repeat domain-containing protein [Arenibacter latericius]MDX1363305.1 HEAT repeat domain-containing protein [Arenibacter latericius]